MTFFEHIDELRGHLFRSVVAIAVGVVFVFLYKDFVFGKIVFGPFTNDFPTYRLSCFLAELWSLPDMCWKPVYQGTFKAIEVSEQFNLHFRVSIVIGLIVASPYIIWEIWRFIKPALKAEEQRQMRYFVLVCSTLFLTGVAFGYFIMSPAATNFLLGYSLPMTKSEPTPSSVVGVMVMLTLPIGLVFQMPVFVYFLARIGLVTHRLLTSSRRIAAVVILIVAAIITPPDVLSQLLVTFPLYGLYELSIMVAKKETLRREKEMEELG